MDANGTPVGGHIGFAILRQGNYECMHRLVWPVRLLRDSSLARFQTRTGGSGAIQYREPAFTTRFDFGDLDVAGK